MKAVTNAGDLELAASKELKPPLRASDDLEIVEAVVMPQSRLVGQNARRLQLRRRFEVSLLAVSRAGRPVTSRLMSHTFQPGDVIALQGWAQGLHETIGDLGCLPLADRSLQLSRRPARFHPARSARCCDADRSVQVAQRRGDVFRRRRSVHRAAPDQPQRSYEAIDWPIIVMLGALIPVGEMLMETGAANLIADFLGRVAQQLPGLIALGLVLTPPCWRRRSSITPRRFSSWGRSPPPSRASSGSMRTRS